MFIFFLQWHGFGHRLVMTKLKAVAGPPNHRKEGSEGGGGGGGGFSQVGYQVMHNTILCTYTNIGHNNIAT